MQEHQELAAVQNEILRNLEQARGTGRLHHALIFAGPQGVGKLATALTWAAALIAPDEAQSGHVRGRLERDSHPDFEHVRAKGNALKVDDIRDLPRKLAYPPLEGKNRVVLLEAADRMTVAAANALLKVLEEPPGYVFFLLLSRQPSRLLPTILSRAQLIRFQPQSIAAVNRRLRALYPDRAETDLLAAAAVSGGATPQAVHVLEDANLLEQVHLAQERLLQVWEAQAVLPPAAVAFCDGIREREQAQWVIRAWTAQARDLALLCESLRAGVQCEPEVLANPHLFGRLQAVGRRLAGEAGLERAALMARHLDQALMDLDANVSARLGLLSLITALDVVNNPEHV